MSDSCATPWTVSHQVPLHMRFLKQEYWSGLPLPSPGYLPDSGISPASPILAGGFLTAKLPGNRFEKTYTLQCSQQHYLQLPRHGSNLSVPQRWMENEDALHICNRILVAAVQPLSRVWLCNPVDCSPPGPPVLPESLPAIRREWTFPICSNMDRHEGYYSKWNSQTEKDTYCMMSHIRI